MVNYQSGQSSIAQNKMQYLVNFFLLISLQKCFVLFLDKNIMLWVLLRVPHWGKHGTYMYMQAIFLDKRSIQIPQVLGHLTYLPCFVLKFYVAHSTTTWCV